jgi:hypothetical protein
MALDWRMGAWASPPRAPTPGLFIGKWRTMNNVTMPEAHNVCPLTWHPHTSRQLIFTQTRKNRGNERRTWLLRRMARCLPGRLCVYVQRADGGRRNFMKRLRITTCLGMRLRPRDVTPKGAPVNHIVLPDDAYLEACQCGCLRPGTAGQQR